MCSSTSSGEIQNYNFNAPTPGRAAPRYKHFPHLVRCGRTLDASTWTCYALPSRSLLTKPKCQIYATITSPPVSRVESIQLLICACPQFSMPLTFDLNGKSQRANRARDVDLFVVCYVSLGVKYHSF